MKYCLLFIAGVLLTGLSVAQVKFKKLKVEDPPTVPYSKEVLAIEKQNHTCVRINVKNFSARSKIFPFSKATQIKLVSFQADQLPRQNDTVDYSKLMEIATLSLPQIDSLSDVLYNYGYGGTILAIEETRCYDPRNAILFINNQGATFAFMEICFQCAKMVTSPENINPGDFCNEKFDLLKKRFVNAGVRYGSTELN
jgi:hypothetical protein